MRIHIYVYKHTYIHFSYMPGTQGSCNIIKEVETIEELEDGIVCDKMFCKHDIVVTFMKSLQLWLYPRDLHGFNLTKFHQTALIGFSSY